MHTINFTEIYDKEVYTIGMRLFFRSKPKHDVSRQEIRNLTHFSIFALNMSASDWLPAQYPVELVTELAEVEKRLAALSTKHCVNRVWQPLKFNILLDKLHLPNIFIRLNAPIDVVGYINTALDEMNTFCETYNIFETKFFWPSSCPKDSIPFTNPNIANADRLYDDYQRALTR